MGNRIGENAKKKPAHKHKHLSLLIRLLLVKGVMQFF
jgi:hypothetical protein